MQKFGPTCKFQSQDQAKLFDLLAKHKTIDPSVLLNDGDVLALVRNNKRETRKILYWRLRGRVAALMNRLSVRQQPLPF